MKRKVILMGICAFLMSATLLVAAEKVNLELLS